MKVSRSAVVFAGLLAASAAAAVPRDRTPPTTPTNLRVTGTTPYSVSLAWNPSSDNSGKFSYQICCAYSNMATVPQAATSFTFTAGLEAGRTFSFRIGAVDAAGNASGYSNSVTVRLPADTAPPTKPSVSVTGVGPRHVSLVWSATDNGPNIWYGIAKDGVGISQGGRVTSAIIPLLQNATTYTFTVRAADFAGNLSPISDPVVVTTQPRNANDVTPPTTPGDFSESNWGCETQLSWSESTDDLDPQWILEYQVFVNDVYDHSLSLGARGTTVYGTLDGPNTFSVLAVDTAGNKSEPATVTTSLDCVP